jgi:hypothetical protein
VRRTAQLLLGAALALLLVLAPGGTAPARAGSTQESIMQDDLLLQYGTADDRERTLDEFRELGADTVHATVIWGRLAPRPTSKRRPRFDASDPRAYGAGAWDALDGLVRGARARGLRVLLTPSGAAPAWGSDCSGSVALRRICRPDVREFQRFVTALGRRYSGSYREANGETLPAVRSWSVWNEPNHGAWLRPQYSRRGGSMQPESPYRYRRLLTASLRALRATGHRGDRLLMGETAPIGKTSGAWSKRTMAPLDFYRAVLCVDARGRRLRGRAARLVRCPSKPFRLDVTGVSHHPYGSGGADDPRRRGGDGDLTVASLARLVRLLDGAARAGRVKKRLPLFVTEYGIQTDPPDTRSGASLGRQSEWLNTANYMLYAQPRVHSVAQFELRDERDPDSFNTGLRFADGRAKPALSAYRLPLAVVTLRKVTRVWGQVRPPAPGARPEVEVQYRTSKRSDFKRLRTVTVTNPNGYFAFTTRKRARLWRLVWTDDGGRVYRGRTARASSR